MPQRKSSDGSKTGVGLKQVGKSTRRKVKVKVKIKVKGRKQKVKKKKE